MYVSLNSEFANLYAHIIAPIYESFYYFPVLYGIPFYLAVSFYFTIGNMGTIGIPENQKTLLFLSVLIGEEPGIFKGVHSLKLYDRTNSNTIFYRFKSIFTLFFFPGLTKRAFGL